MKWVTSLAVSFFSSLLFIQPLKVFLITMLIVCICKTDLSVDDTEEDELDPHLAEDEVWASTGRASSSSWRPDPGAPLDSKELRELRKTRQKEKEIWEILKEIAFYITYLGVILVISYGNRDPNAYYLQNNFANAFIKIGDWDWEFLKVRDANRWWYWFDGVVLSELHAQPWYNGDSPLSLRGYLDDRANVLVGQAIIRQIRVKPNSCSIDPRMANLTSGCAGLSEWVNEDDIDYCEGWKTFEEVGDIEKCRMEEFKYSTAKALEAHPIWGKLDVYSGGGYVFQYNGTNEQIISTLRKLRRLHWLDDFTRALLFEFNTYNAQVNMFGTGRVMVEIVPGGGMLPSWRFDGITLLHHHTNFGLFVVITEGAFVVFAVYYTYIFCKSFWKSRYALKKFFSTYWNLVDMINLALSYMAMVFYVLRYIETQRVLKIFKETFGRGYIRLQNAAILDESFGYVIGFLGFSGLISSLKLLRFNRRIGILSATMKQCWDDLFGFAIVFLIAFGSFAAMFYFCLHTWLYEWRSYTAAFGTSFSAMLGKFDFENLRKTHILASAIFFFFSIAMSFIMINILLTIVIKSFEQVKKDLLKQSNDYEIMDFLLMRFKMFIGKNQQPRRFREIVPDTSKTSAADIATHKDLQKKVDEMLDYINNVYFDGKCDFTRKMKKDIYCRVKY